MCKEKEVNKMTTKQQLRKALRELKKSGSCKQFIVVTDGQTEFRVKNGYCGYSISYHNFVAEVWGDRPYCGTYNESTILERYVMA